MRSDIFRAPDSMPLALVWRSRRRRNVPRVAWVIAVVIIALTKGATPILSQSTEPDAFCGVKMALSKALSDTAGAIIGRKAVSLFPRAAFAFGEAARLARECDHVVVAALMSANLGGLHSEWSQFDSARTHLDSTNFYLNQAIGTLDSLEAIGYADSASLHRVRGTALNTLAVSYRRISQFDAAIQYLTAALRSRRVAGDTRGEGVTLNGLAEVLHTIGRRREALWLYQQGLAARLKAGDQPGRGVSYYNLGTLYSEIGEIEKAIIYADSAIIVRRNLGDTIGVAMAVNLQGRIASDAGRYEEALASHRRAYTVSERHGALSVAGWARLSAGKLLADRGHATAAIREDSIALRHFASLRDGLGMAVTLRELARWNHRITRPRDLRTAVALYERAATFFRAIERHLTLDPLRLSITEEQRGSLFEEWVLAELAEGGPTAALEALAVMEEGRTQALLDLMRGVTPAQPIEPFFQSPGPATDTATTVLYYVATVDTLVIWLKTGSQISVTRQPISRSQLEKRVARVRTLIGPLEDLETCWRSNDSISSGQRLNAALDSLATVVLPASVQQRMPTTGDVLVVPHGVLHLVPFGALRVGRSGEPLGIRYGLRYAPSLSVLAHARARRVTDSIPARRPFLVVADPTMPHMRVCGVDGFRLDPLPQSGRFADSLARRQGAVALMGSRATEGRVKALLPAAGIVHLATHGYAYLDETRALDTWIALAPDSLDADAAGRDDGLLTVGEILKQISLRADLIVLAACRTGLGDLKQAEGTVGLHRALLARGASSVLVSQWIVSEDATVRLFEHFYHFLFNEGLTKGEALRKAQLSLRGAPGSPYHEPRYWAAFQLVGLN